MPHDHPHRDHSLQGQRGRPSKALPSHKDGHTTGTVNAGDRMNIGDLRRPLAHEAASGAVQMAPRLLDLHAAAHYLSLSIWTLRTLEHSGLLARVRVPMAPEAQQRPRGGHNGGGCLFAEPA